jgi:hypothetical protein
MSTAEQLEEAITRHLDNQDILVKKDQSGTTGSEPIYYEVGLREKSKTGEKTTFSLLARRFYPNIGPLTGLKGMTFHSDEDIWKGVILAEDRVDLRRR